MYGDFINIRLDFGRGLLQYVVLTVAACKKLAYLITPSMVALAATCDVLAKVGGQGGNSHLFVMFCKAHIGTCS